MSCARNINFAKRQKSQTYPVMAFNSRKKTVNNQSMILPSLAIRINFQPGKLGKHIKSKMMTKVGRWGPKIH